jgi:O-methyltransferase domain/Dimerisation domain
MGAFPVEELRRLVDGHQVSQAIHVAAVLGIAQRLVEGPRTSDELAESAGAHAPSLYRLLRALAAIGVFEEQDGRRFALTPLGEALRTEVGPWAEFSGSPSVWAAWGDLLHSIRTGENAFAHVHGRDVWQHRAERPEESELFDRAMTANSRIAERALLDAYDFSRFGVVADIGGGRGALIAAILEANPAVRGILFDQAHVVEKADAIDRCEVLAGSFFDEVPVGADAYVLRHIVHDWEDAEAVALLRVVRAAMSPSAVVLIVERDLARTEAKFADLNMLVNPGGRERTSDEYAELLEEAGLRLTRVTPAGSHAVFEAEPIQAANARSK